VSRAAGAALFARLRGLYSLHGRLSRDALGDTAGNFVRVVPATLLVSAVIAALAGVVLFGEPITSRLAAASVLVLGAVRSRCGAISPCAWHAAAVERRAGDACARAPTHSTVAS